MGLRRVWDAVSRWLGTAVRPFRTLIGGPPPPAMPAHRDGTTDRTTETARPPAATLNTSQPPPSRPDRIAVGGYLDPQAVDRLRRLIARLDQVVLDTSQVTGFSSTGLAALLALQSSRPAGAITIEGLEVATSRLVGLTGDEPPITISLDDAPATDFPRAVRVSVLNHVAVALLTPEVGEFTGEQLATALRGTVREGVTTVVVDLIGAPVLPSALCWDLAEVLAELTLLGRHVLVVNVAPAVAAVLSRVGLAADVYVAVSSET